ncbi:thiosulfate sulfurtransferase-like [Ostrea edulis]|uniref:thiosulfate sulfurtransferase-like n=1 Tax=Ostrea edulis TaxID=37623 RepID=UPI0024AFCFA7|nr:thiosulfate sulfurtransferase-like [Ostrea edulis]
MFKTKHEEMFVSCQWLKDTIAKGCHAGDIVILDVSWASDGNMEEEYRRGHIPGARYFHIMDDNHTEMYPRNIPSPENFQRRARQVGINNNSHLVLYSNSQHCGLFASGRAWWTFTYFGHRHISVLDGGLTKWIKENGDIVKDCPTHSVGNFSVEVHKEIRVEFDEMIQFVEKQGQIIDSRANDKLNLEDPSSYIGNAINIPMSFLVNDDTIKPKEELQSYLVEQGVNLSDSVVCYCNSGMSSCSLTMAILYCGGQARLYTGGYNEWKRRDKL